jgi:hypothetical protein
MTGWHSGNATALADRVVVGDPEGTSGCHFVQARCFAGFTVQESVRHYTGASDDDLQRSLRV